jgi:hypothetical protein
VKNVQEISSSLFAASKSSQAVFFKYMRKSIETIDFLPSKANHHLQKHTENYRSPVSLAERLIVTIM